MDSYLFFIKGQLIGLLLLALWVEYGPKMGGVLFRLNHWNQKQLNLSGFLHFCLSPLWTSAMWYPSYWDLNAIIVTTICGFCNHYAQFI